MRECIKVENLTKKYKGRTVVDALNFTVEEGEVFGLLGHNGAGKTTTIETILGLKKVESGSVRIWEKNPRKHRKELFEKIGVQLQASNYQPLIRVDEICKEFSALYKNPRDYKELLREFGLDKFEKAQVVKLSGGEKQKLSIVLALISEPKLIFLDELTTGLDTVARRDVWNSLRGLKEKGTTIVLTTHYMEEAKNLCDRVMLIKDGKKVIEGTVEEVISNSPYNNMEEAYLWYMNEGGVAS